MKKLPFIFIFLFLPVTLFSQTPADGSSILNELRKIYGPKNSATLSFDLTIFWSVREKYEKKSGNLVFSPGEKFRLTLGNSTWVSNGQVYWQYSKKTNQVVIKNLLDLDLDLHPSSMMQSFLSYPFTVHASDDKAIVFQWRGESKNSDFPYKKIVVNVDKKEILINELIVTDDDNNESRYTFKKSKLGGVVQASVFEFEIPEGVDVLDMRN